jgi:hypothetical protein
MSCVSLATNQEKSMPVSARIWRSSLTAIAVVAVAAVTPLAAGAPAAAATPLVSRLCAPPADTVPPQLTSLTFSTKTIDLTNGPRRVTVTAHATDTAAGVASGVQDIELEFSGPHGGTATIMNLVSGTPADGTWKGSVGFSRDDQDGTWSVDDLIVEDAQGNGQLYEGSGKTLRSPTDLRLHPDWDSSLTVTGSAGGNPPPPGHPGAKLGKLTAFRLAPKSVNTTHHAKTVKVTAAFSRHRPTDVELLLLKAGDGGIGIGLNKTKTGISTPSAASTYARVASGKAAPAAFFFKVVRLKRTTHGRWAGHVKIGKWAGHIVAQPTLVAVFGNADKLRFKEYNADRLHVLHFTHSLKITSGVDTTKPVLTGLRVTPTSVDTTSGAQLVTVTARATDKQSGVALVQAQIESRQEYDTRGSSLRVRMTRHGNVWSGQAKVRECVPSGTWKVSVDMVDHAENVASYSSKMLLAAGLPGTVSVTSHPGDSVPPSVKSATASGAGHMITLDFTEGVKNVTDSTLSVFAMAPASARFQSTLAVSHIACSDGTGTVACSGSGGLVTSAVLTVPTVTAGKNYEVWANQDSITSQLTDGAGNPVDWSFQVADVTGS